MCKKWYVNLVTYLIRVTNVGCNAKQPVLVATTISHSSFFGINFITHLILEFGKCILSFITCWQWDFQLFNCFTQLVDGFLFYWGCLFVWWRLPTFYLSWYFYCLFLKFKYWISNLVVDKIFYYVKSLNLVCILWNWNIYFCVFFSPIIQLTIDSDINVPCSENSVYVYDGLPDFVSLTGSHQSHVLGIFCTQDTQYPVTVEARSG